MVRVRSLESRRSSFLVIYFTNPSNSNKFSYEILKKLPVLKYIKHEINVKLGISCYVPYLMYLTILYFEMNIRSFDVFIDYTG